MNLPMIHGTARLLEDPTLRFSASGVAVCKLRLVFNSRRKNDQTGAWEDSDSFFVDGVLFKQEAENAAESYQRQSEVVVVGRLKTHQWEDKDGNKRSSPELVIESIGASTKFATATINKMARSGGQQQPAAGGDPWATAAPASGSTSPSKFDDEAPF